MSTYSNAHAKVKNWIFDVQFPGNWFDFGVILNNFWSFTIWAIQIQVSITELQIRKKPGIQPRYFRVRVFKGKDVLVLKGKGIQGC